MSWTDLGAGVFVKRYEAGDLNVAAIVGPNGVTIVDTQGSPAEAQELMDDVAQRFNMPVVAVINTHAHYDHSFGNSVFANLGVPIFGHHRIPSHYADFEGPRLAAWQADPACEPDKQWEKVLLTIPTVLIDQSMTLTSSGRDITCMPISRGHTDTDLAVVVPDARVWLLGDLVEESGPPMFGSGSWPLDWPIALDEVLLGLRPGDLIVPGHGQVVDRAFAMRQTSALHGVADAIRGSRAAGHSIEEASHAADLPWPEWMLRSAFEQGFSHLGTAPHGSV
ncbi:MBL fold metallo-hydrolase [Arthrobacter sp. PAMC 25486]|uniref:MBL fold metallo-hydrolase n=1 Tax=Arthrobacter sp. PAMC 25486 TaxID=1494608 RepID=UPI00056E711A|nr:MBL fold metallo-hydrolase [Arthrobacter sp. PAMC 25486]